MRAARRIPSRDAPPEDVLDGPQRRLLLELNAIFTHASLGIIYTRDRIIERCNPRAEEILGYAAGELIGQSGQTVHPGPAAYEAVGRTAGPILATCAPFRDELQLRRKDGGLIWCQVFARAIDPQDTQSGTIWMFDDVEAARSSRRELQAIMDNASVGIVFTRNRTIVRYNAKFAELVRLGGDSWIDQPTRIFFESDQAFADLSAAAFPRLSVGQSFQSEMKMRRHDGTLFFAEVIGYLMNPQDPPEGTIWLVADISARVADQDRLKMAVHDLQAIMNNASVGILRTRERKIVEYNPRFAELFGFAGPSGIGLPARVLYRSDDEYADVGRQAGPRLSMAQPFQHELYMRRQDGASLWINLIGYVSNPQHTSESTIWILEDRTAFKRAEDALRESHAELEQRVVERTQALAAANARLADFADAASDWLWEMGPDLRFSYFSDRIHRALGVDTQIYLGKSRWELMHPDDIDARWRQHFEMLERRLEFRDFEYRLKKPDGEYREISISGKPIFAADGTFLGYRGIGRDITEQKRAEATLRESEEQLRSIIDRAPAIVYLKSVDGRYLRVNSRFGELLGTPAESIAGKADTDLFPPALAQSFAASDRTVIETGHATEIEEQVTTDGVTRTFLSVKFPLRRPSGEIFAVGGISTDITERTQIEQNLRIAATTFESQEGMVITDASERILRVNKAFTEITGYDAEEAVGQTPRLLRSGRHDAAFYRSMWQSVQDSGTWSGELWNRRKNGELYPQFQSITAVRSADGTVTHYVGTFTDITLRKRAEEEIRDLAFYDPLTRLPNRRLLIDRLHHALAGLERSHETGALMFIDLDNFKVLNDTRGHDVGDALLTEVGRRLTAAIRQQDTVARLGGDEFVIMLTGLERDGLAAAHAEVVGMKILESIARPYELIDKAGRCFEYRSSASIGITLFSSGDQAIDEILKQADLSMYQAKAAGRNTLRFFDPVMQAEASRRAALETDLRHAIDCQQLELHYQPQVDDAGCVVGVEGLLRWRHAERGMVMPGEFIALAEETGLILPLGNQVLQAACRLLRDWSKRPERAHLTVAVNVSALQMNHVDFVEQVASVVAATRIDPSRLKLEITESLLMKNPVDAVDKMLALKALGTSFSLDDFGTGYSSLAYLKQLPLDQIKIDRSFVRALPEDANDAVICRTIVALGQSLGFDLIAEGVETEAQVAFLQGIGCAKMQGYFYSRPLPVDQLDVFLDRARTAR